MKTSELSGIALDWAVAKASGHTDYICRARLQSFKRPTVGSCNYPDADSYWPYAPSTDWAQGGPILAEEKICLWSWGGDYEACYNGLPNEHICTGPTPLVAAMRCFVSMTLGSELDVPKELL